MSTLTASAQREVDRLNRIAADASLDPARRVAALLTAHQRWDVGGCLCGWAKLGWSHAGHQADMLAAAGLLTAGTEDA